jgi:hypothetical protein
MTGMDQDRDARERQFSSASTAPLARPSESTVYSAEGAVRPLNTLPMDPRDADY